MKLNYFTFLIAFTASAQQKTQPTLDYYLPQMFPTTKTFLPKKCI
jgi:hypothetical protein